MADMRSCVKTGCRWPAAATLSYRYATAQVWLTDMAEAHPATHDLCPHHADTMRVPKGWSLVDTRQPMQAPREPSAAEIAERVSALRSSVTTMLSDIQAQRRPRQPSRYDVLLADLPRHLPEGGAAERDAVDAVDAVDHGQPIGSTGSTAVADDAHGQRTTDLAPRIRERVAEMAGTVVGTLEIDLTDHPSVGGVLQQDRDVPGRAAVSDPAPPAAGEHTGAGDAAHAGDAEEVGDAGDAGDGPRQPSLLDDAVVVPLPSRPRLNR